MPWGGSTAQTGARTYKDQSDYHWRLYTKVVMQYVELTEQHVNLLLRRNT